MASTDDVSRKRVKLERCPPGHDGRDVALSDLAGALFDRYVNGKGIDDLEEADTLNRAALELRPDENGQYHRSSSLNNLAVCLSIKYDEQGVVDDLEEAIALGRHALELRPPGHANRGVSLFNLADNLRKRFEKQALMHDLNEAIELHHQALELYPPGHLDRSSSLRELALCLSDRYENQGGIDDLEEVVTLRRAQLELCLRGHPNHTASLHNLACDLRRRFTKKAVISDLEEAIELLRQAVKLRLPGHFDRSSSLYELALCLSNRYDKQGLVNDLEEAITLGRGVLALRLPGQANRGESLHSLARDLRKRFVKLAAIQDLEKAIELHRATLELRPAGHPNRSLSLRDLAPCLSNRYDKLGVIDDLQEAISLGRMALELWPPEHADHGESLHNLACDLRRRFAKEFAICDLQEAIELFRPALELRPSGHPDRSSSLHELSLCLSNRHAMYGVVDDLEEAIALGRAALELCPTGHPNRAVVLYNLARNLWKIFQKQINMPELHGSNFPDQAAAVVCPTSSADVASSLFGLSIDLLGRFQKQAATTDLDDAISLATYALELRLSDEDVSVARWVQRLAQDADSDEPVTPARVADNLCVLANCHRARYQTKHAIVDLNETITLYCYILQLRPAGHPGRASSLHDLAQCLAERFRREPAAADLDQVIAFEQEALELLVRGDPDYGASRCCLTTYLQMKISSQVAMISPDPSGVGHFDIEQIIRNVAFDTLKTAPIRLLHTPTGVLCSRDAQVLQFMRSQQCKQLLSLCTACDRAQQMGLIQTNLSEYFQYVMLSHRWGDGEPSSRDIEGYPIYGMSPLWGFGKLQAFCAVACELDYLWAWSDTCCIDKHSSAEVQETIGSMFAWYRQSALTIVYLSDVPDTGSFGSSEWFGRVWTLQELLAPKRILFHTKNWSLYKNISSSNHETDVAVLDELERAAGIESRFLTNFFPGLDDARSRLQWASLRRTTRPEDIAYSLFGIFNLHFQFSKIISRSGDISVLDWVGQASSFHSCFPAHISSYQTVSLPPPQLNTEELSSTISQEFLSFEVLRCFTMSLLPRFLGRPSTPSSTAPTIRLRTPDSYAPSNVYDFNSFTRAPLPRFRNRCLILPCIAHRVTAVQLTGEDPSTPSYTYKIHACGLRPLEIALPDKLESVTISQDALQLVRPWHSKGQSAALDAANEEKLLVTLGKPFKGLLLTELPHSQYKRIGSSTLITAQPVDSISILKSKIRIFNIV
ncbi:hypothetical protein F5J12DRAFT_939108 [Pisolithus orientalis]|uniref:uncharacterized protein n=1 Tax=Pisolithus orientalis TaxID=936130 RepID=UPI002224A6D5|nr:uncharacterized protein F5J12DRAFT_939108 [Pisolithus orientalis]KAI6006550.1 hypothetical protein F5J12DRAFT_939108 [Pisolithus orientalis]